MKFTVEDILWFNESFIAKRRYKKKLGALKQLSLKSYYKTATFPNNIN